MKKFGYIETAVAMAHDAVLRQQKDGRLAVINYEQQEIAGH